MSLFYASGGFLGFSGIPEVSEGFKGIQEVIGAFKDISRAFKRVPEGLGASGVLKSVSDNPRWVQGVIRTF